MSYGAQQRTPLWSGELYALGVPPMWAVCALLLQADYCGCSGRWSWLLTWLAIRPCLVKLLQACCGME